MKKKFLVCLTCILALVLTSTLQARPKGTLRIAVSTLGDESTDPIVMESFWAMQMCDRLIMQNEKGDFEPSLATSWNISDNGLVWTFQIREGVKFHNGDPLTAEDVAWSLTRFASKESTNPWSGSLRAALVSVEATDKYTVVLTTNKPEAPLVVPIGWARILPKKYFNEVGQDGFRKNPIGSGPWKWGKLISKTRAELIANTEYWGQVPAFNKYIEYMVPEESTRVAMLKRGDVDIAMALSMDRVVELDKAGFTLQELGPPTLFSMSFQGTYYKEAGPMYHKKFRKALSYAVNRQELCETYYLGYCRPGGMWYMSESSWGWPAEFKPDPYDPETAKQYLKDIGYPKNFEDPVIQVNTAAYSAEQVQALIGYWDDIGIQVKINVMDNGPLNQYRFVRIKDANAGNVGAIFDWIFPVAPYNVYHSLNMYKSTGIHSTGNDPEMDKMYDDAASEMNPELAKKKWAAFTMAAKEMYINVGYVYTPSYIVLGKKVAKFRNYGHLQFMNEMAHYIEPN